MAKQVIIPLPDRDFDTTEISIPWKHFVAAGLHVTLATAAPGLKSPKYRYNWR